MTGVITGRVWGYADEVDGFMRSLRYMADRVQEGCPDSAVSVTALNEKVIGQRGWFTKRVMTKVEYRITLDNNQQREPIERLLRSLAARLS